MKLVDTSSWVEYLRDRESEAGDSVKGSEMTNGVFCLNHFRRADLALRAALTAEKES